MKLNYIAGGLALALLAGCATDSGYATRDGYQDRRPYQDDRYEGRYEDRYDDRYARCYECGRVERIERYRGDGRTSGAGAVTGAVVGGALGNQVGGGSGRTAATVAGAVLGGLAGNEIEEDASEATRYDLFIRMEDGRRLIVTQRDLAGVREGSVVRIDGGRARLL